jgi:inner membrane protein
MNVFTHFFAGWALAEANFLSRSDRVLVTWSAVAPDLDGLSILPDLANRALGRPETDFYFRYHHVWTHGLPAAIVATAVAIFLATRKLRTALLVFAAFHIHLLMDLVGSRGPSTADIWPIGYLEPISSRLTFSWDGQWPLNDWKNVLLSILLIAWALRLAVRRGYSPVSLFSERADAAVVRTLRDRFRRGR